MKRFILLVALLLIGFYVAWPAFSGYRIYQGLEGGQPDLLAAKIDFPSVRQSMRGPVLDQVNTRIESVMRDLGPATALMARQIPRDNIEKIIDGALLTVVSPEKITEIYARDGDLNAAIKDAVLNEINKMGGLFAVLKLDALLGAGDKDGSGVPKDEGTIGGLKIPGGLGGLLQNKRVQETIGGMIGKAALDPEKIAAKLFPSRAVNDQAGTGRPGANGAKPAYGISNIKSFGFNGPFAMQLGVARAPEAEMPEVTTEMAFQNYDWRITKLTPNLLER